MILVLHAHPYPATSRAGAALLDAVRDLPSLEVRSLYDRYPDFDIDPAAERAALEAAHLVVWTHPIYWYSVPALLKHWFDVVLVRGWAYGEGGTKLRGKPCLWVPTAGGDGQAYTPEGRHRHPFEAFVPVVEQTARYCGMHWLRPLVVQGAHSMPEHELKATARQLRHRLERFIAEKPVHA